MQERKRNIHVSAILVNLLVIALASIVMWGLVSVTPGGSSGSGDLGPKTRVPTVSQAPTSPATATSAFSLDLPGTATQRAVATIVALKEMAATARAVEMTTSPYPTEIPNPGKIIVLEKPTLELLVGEGLKAQNAWVGNINGRAVAVYAGASIADPNEGIVLVMWGRPNGGQQRFIMPGKHGSVIITAEVNRRLTLASTDNSTFHFDVPGLRLVGSITEVVPTINFSLIATPPIAPTSPAATAYP